MLARRASSGGGAASAHYSTASLAFSRVLSIMSFHADAHLPTRRRQRPAPYRARQASKNAYAIAKPLELGHVKDAQAFYDGHFAVTFST